MPPVSPGTLDTSSVYAVLGEWRERVGIKQFETLTKVTSNTIYARRAYGLTYSFGELLAIGEKAGVIPQTSSFEDRWSDQETQRVRATVIKESKERHRFIGAVELSILCELTGIRWVERELCKCRTEGFTKAFELLARNGLSEVTGRRSIEWLEAAAQFARSQWSSPLAQALWVAHHRGYDTEGEFIRCEGLPKQSTYSVMRRVREGEMVTDGELRSVSLLLGDKGWIAPLFLARLQEGQSFVVAASETLRRINLLGDATLNNQQRHITLQATKRQVNQALFDVTLSHENLNDLYLRKTKLVARSSGRNSPLPCSETEVTENALAALMLKLPGITKVELEEALGQL